MPKTGMEAIRREALISATIDEIGRSGLTEVTVAQIARKAGVSSALAHHYFGSKERLIFAAIRHILTVFGRDVRAGLAKAKTSRGRVDAIVSACFAPGNFRPDVANTWLNIFILARTYGDASRLLAVYHKRLQSNLAHALRPLAGDRSREIAASTAALIDGIYLRQVLGTGQFGNGGAQRLVGNHLDLALGHVD